MTVSYLAPRPPVCPLLRKEASPPSGLAGDRGGRRRLSLSSRSRVSPRNLRKVAARHHSPLSQSPEGIPLGGGGRGDSLIIELSQLLLDLAHTGPLGLKIQAENT